MGEESTGVFDALVQFVIEGDSACGCPRSYRRQMVDHLTR